MPGQRTLNSPAPDPLSTPGAITPGSIDFGGMSNSQALGYSAPGLDGPLGQYGYQPVTTMGADAGGGGIMGNIKGLFSGGGAGGAGGFGSLSGYGGLLEGAASVFSAYTGYKNMKLAKEQLQFTKAATNRNIENQAIVTNEALGARSRARSAFGGKKSTPVQVSGAAL